MNLRLDHLLSKEHTFGFVRTSSKVKSHARSVSRATFRIIPVDDAVESALLSSFERPWGSRSEEFKWYEGRAYSSAG